MFFIQTIRDFINDKRESREARRLSADSMNRYFDIGEHVHDSLIAAEEIMASGKTTSRLKKTARSRSSTK